MGFWIDGQSDVVWKGEKVPDGSPDLIVNLEEFADLCGVTAETMRVHVKAVDGTASWLLERGDRGRGYKIEPTGGIAWWKSKRADDEANDAERKAQLQQMRLDLIGDQVEAPDKLGMSGRQRREEYLAAEAAAKYRRMMGDLLDRAEMEAVLASAAVELRRQLMQVPGEFGVVAGLDPEIVAPLEGMLKRAVEDFLRTLAQESPESLKVPDV